MFFLLILFSVLFCKNIYSQDFLPIDTVYSFSPGSGQNSGQEPEYYPENIFGLPSEIANEDVQEVMPEELLSLGLGGEIVVGLKNRKIYNIPGPDFFIYENVFKNPYKDIIFAEPAIVSASKDGEEYVAFPFDSVTLEGCAGTKPTLTKDKEYDPYNCGGDAFDLDDIFMAEIKYIKIKDITQMLINNPGHKYYDPTLSGFDLDAVIITGTEQFSSVGNSDNTSFINTSEIFSVETKFRGNFNLYNLSGKLIYSKSNTTNFTIFKNNLQKGVYFVNIIFDKEIVRYKFMK